MRDLKPHSNRIRRTKGDIVFDTVNYCVLILAMLLVLYPLYFVAIASFSEPIMVNTGRVFLLPKSPSLDGYNRIFSNEKIWNGYFNTILYTVAGTALNISLTMTVAYTLTVRRFSLKKILLVYLMIPVYFSGGLIPTFLQVKALGIENTRWALIVLNGLNVMNAIIARSFIRSSVPTELNEAAEIDGCSHFGLFFRIVLPLSKAGIAVLVLYYAVAHWNEYMLALIYLRNPKLYSLQIILREILLQNQAQDFMDDIISATEKQRAAELIKYGVVIVSSLPMLILYPFLQKYFVKGTLIGSIKG
ncbi:MAG: carbohydrate ABC transporter permease [Clostridia bacterium]|nr:carbohydrate ABC transporter permease [Clostridia bacterium]